MSTIVNEILEQSAPTQHGTGQGAGRNQCPKCGSTTSWGMGSWCPDCGYYPRSDGDETQAADASELRCAVEAETVSDGYPAWMVATGVGGMVILLVSISLRVYFHIYGDGYRALIGVGGLLTGVIATCAAQVGLTLFARKKDNRVKLLDAIINPFMVWQSAADRPEACRSWIQTFVWGLTLVFCSTVVIGGIPWGRFDELIAVEETDRGPGAIDRAIGDGGELEDEGNSEVNTSPETNTGLPEEPPEFECALYGVTPDGTSDAGQFMIARMFQGEWTHAATINGDDIPPEDARTILRSIPELRTTEPLVATRYRAIWVEPKIRIRLQAEKSDGNGELVKPVYLEYLFAESNAD